MSCSLLRLSLLTSDIIEATLAAHTEQVVMLESLERPLPGRLEGAPCDLPYDEIALRMGASSAAQPYVARLPLSLARVMSFAVVAREASSG
jgi:hypothetical protein